VVVGALLTSRYPHMIQEEAEERSRPLLSSPSSRVSFWIIIKYREEIYHVEMAGKGPAESVPSQLRLGGMGFGFYLPLSFPVFSFLMSFEGYGYLSCIS